MRAVIALIVAGMVGLGVWVGFQQRRVAPRVPPVLEPIQTERPLRDLLPSGFDRSKISLLVEKSKYRLTVLYQNRPVKHYPIVLGTNPRDDKRFEGDACTPEGEFRITARRPHRSWTHFLLLNYPTSASYRKHNAAKRRGLIPRNATVGSAIGIHGVPKGGDDWIDRRENWTLGCVSLKTAAIREIYATTQNGTKVRIKP